jgi:hypothetical protein
MSFLLGGPALGVVARLLGTAPASCLRNGSGPGGCAARAGGCGAGLALADGWQSGQQRPDCQLNGVCRLGGVHVPERAQQIPGRRGVQHLQRGCRALTHLSGCLRDSRSHTCREHRLAGQLLPDTDFHALGGMQHRLDQRGAGIETGECPAHVGDQFIGAAGGETGAREAGGDPPPQPHLQIGLGGEMPVDRPFLHPSRPRDRAVGQVSTGFHQRRACRQDPLAGRRGLRLAEWRVVPGARFYDSDTDMKYVRLSITVGRPRATADGGGGQASRPGDGVDF